MESLSVQIRPGSEVAAGLQCADALLRAAMAANTRDAYTRDWKAWETWCASMGLAPLPAQESTVRLWVGCHAYTSALSTLERRLVTVNRVHQAAGFPPPGYTPEIRDMMRGLRRLRAGSGRRAAAMTIDDVRAMVQAAGPGLLGARDRAILLLGFATGLRRAELAGLQVAHVEISSRGLALDLPWSKTGPDQRIGVLPGRASETCPVRAVQQWIDGAGVVDGSLFRSVSRWGRVGESLSPRAIAIVVARLARAAGLAVHYSPHSLRAGMATEAARAGCPERLIQRQTRHRSLTVLRGYIRDGELLGDNASGWLGL